MALFQIAEPGLSAAPHEHRLAVGIDLGTTNSLVASVISGSTEVILDEGGAAILPSVVHYAADDTVTVGAVALRDASRDPKNTISSAKRLIGRTMKDLADVHNLPYDLVDDPSMVRIATSAGVKSPVEVSAEILRSLAKRAEDRLGGDLTGAVITVPAYFDDAQRQATKDAARLANLTVLRLLNEPTAAALAYGLDNGAEGTYMVYDLGGGTFDVSVLEIGDGVIEVLATAGNNRLGGDDFDQRVIDWIADEFKKSEGVDLRGDKMAMQRLKEAAEKAKIELSNVTTSTINLPFIGMNSDGTPLNLEMTLTRAKFNELTADLVEATMGPVRQAISDSGLKTSDLHKILMVGGSSRIPAVQEAVKKYTGVEPFKGINPDECVAVGAAIQGGVLQGDVKGLLLLDVTPLSLGIETLGGVCTKIIDRNTTIPTHKSQVFSTAADNQPSVEVNVLQGEREFARDNKSLGVFHLDGIAPAPRGVPQIEVTFDIDANGIVKVSAKDLGTGKEQNITITASTNMSKEDIDKAVKEAEQFAADDKKKREEVDIRNGADQMVFQTEKMLKENGDKLPADVKSDAEAKLADLKTAVQSGNVDDIKAKQEALSQVFEKMYQAAAAAQQAAGAQPGADAGATNEKPNDDGVVDADFKEV